METDSSKIIAQLLKDGWVLKSSRGFHQKFERNGQVVVVPHPKKDLPIGTARNIAKAAG